MRLIDIEPYQKDGWILQKTEEGHDCTVIKRTPLHAIPTADSLGVIRCKDCKYAFFKDGLVAVGHIFCTKPGTERGQAVKTDDWYCADGERAEGR